MAAVDKYGTETFMLEKDNLSIADTEDPSPSWEAIREWPNDIGVSATYLIKCIS
jgi:hypothetical protein